MNNQKQSYWVYSIALFIAWAIVFILTWVIKGGENLRTTTLVFLGFLIGWLSATIKHFLLTKSK